MSERIKIFGRWVFERRTVAGTLYCLNAGSMAFGAAFVAMKPEEWAAMSGMQKAGWILLLLGNLTNTLKAFISTSSEKKS
jgi:hypothetical protein